MADKTSELVIRIRERMTERAMNGAPYWTAPVVSSAQSTAGCLLVGTLTGRLPNEDGIALCDTLAEEQNADGSWSHRPGDPGDLSLTLEVVEALSEARDANCTDCLESAIEWLENRRDRANIAPATLFLLRSLTDLPKSRLERWLGKFGGWLMRRRSLRLEQSTVRPAYWRALRVLSLGRTEALGESRELLEMQYVDGSWDGMVRSTVIALLALRHSGLSYGDSAYERGWRFLLAQQSWRDEALVQNPYDASNLLHATALRALITTGADPELTATSILTLLHQQRTSGGWSAGGLMATDLFTTASALDALSFAGDTPVETCWSRRRAALALVRSQQPDGGWPLLYGRLPLFRRWTGRTGSPLLHSRADVTAIAVQAMAYSAVQDPSVEQSTDRGVRYLLNTQKSDGMWRTGQQELDVFATGRAVEALLGASPEKSRGAVTMAVRALLRRQLEDGGWGSTHDTAWTLRALAGMPGVPVEVMKRGRSALESSVDPESLAWEVNGAGMPLPAREIMAGSSDLTTLWALEALAPISAAAKTRRNAGRKSRSISDRRL